MSDECIDYPETIEPRRTALTTVFGQPSDTVHHSPFPLYLGGNADVHEFPHYKGGTAFVTAGLTGNVCGVGQKANSSGNYELVMCDRTGGEDWIPGFLSRLAPATQESVYSSGETMDLPWFPNTGAHAVLFLNLNTAVPYELFGRRYGLLLCVGITEPELKLKQSQGAVELVNLLKNSGVLPWTSRTRKSVT
jgi:hypothetical protein